MAQAAAPILIDTACQQCGRWCCGQPRESPPLSTESAGNTVGKRWTSCGQLPWTGLRQGRPCAAQELGVTVNDEEGAPCRSENAGNFRSGYQTNHGGTSCLKSAVGRPFRVDVNALRHILVCGGLCGW